MDEEVTYSSLIGLIERLEEEAKGKEYPSIDLSQFFEIDNASKENKPSYEDVIRMLEDSEKKRRKEGEMLQRVTQASAAVIQPKEYGQQLEEQAKKAKGELESIISEIKLEKIHLRLRKVKQSELILPNLSPTDQISELEKIIEGLKENVFDEEHLAIIKEEIYGLLDSVNKSKKKISKKEVVLTDFDRSVMELRDERLNDALALLEKR